MRKPFSLPNRMTVATPAPLEYEKLYENVFTKEECELIISKYGNDPSLFYGMVGSESFNVIPSHRVVKTMDITEEMEPWLYTRIVELVYRINEETFKFDLYGMLDDFVLGVYNADNGEYGNGHFTWHVDAAGGTSAFRKLSVIVALSDPTEYEGGEFQVFSGGIANYSKLDQGSVIVFPSYMQHRVTPVTEGSRKVLINFAVGPRFR